ncbi:MAG: hypothetical protein HQL39_15445 [Alphaproteobacteria bacterium]|nr:hypothetical protein [Alphaproteobacteria bacterium]
MTDLYGLLAWQYPDAESEEATELLVGVLTEVANATAGRAPLAPMKLEAAIRTQAYRITDCLGGATENTRPALVEIAALAITTILAMDAPGEAGEHVTPPAGTVGQGAGI